MKTKVFYAAGPGAVIDTYRFWKQGLDDPLETSVCYSTMFFEVCQKLGLEGYVVSSHQRRELLHDGPFVVEHRPPPRWATSGLSFHVGEIVYALSLFMTAWRFGAKVAVIADLHHWYAWSFGPLFGIQIVPTLHCAFWPPGFPDRSWKTRVMKRLNSWFWRFIPRRTICISPEVRRQLGELAGAVACSHAVQARPHYRLGVFDSVPKASRSMEPFRIMYAGRIERNKGVFDVVNIANKLKSLGTGNTDFVFEICGSGSAEEELRNDVRDRGLAKEVLILGKLDRGAMLEAFGRNHVVIVPTTASFAEGLNKVAVEAILSGRPCIISRVLSVGEVLGDAVIEVPTGDIDAYVAAIKRLHNDPEEYTRLEVACQRFQEQFYDAEVSWGRVLERVLRELLSASSNDGVAVQGL